MALMPLPHHRRIDPARLRDQLLQEPLPQIRRAVVVHDGPDNAAVTRVPYLMVPLHGALRCAVDDGMTAIDPGSAIHFLPGSNVQMTVDRQAYVLRITWDTTHCFVARQLINDRQVVDTPFPAGIEGCVLAGPPERLAEAVLARLAALDRADEAHLAPGFIQALLSEVLFRLGHGDSGTAPRRSRWADVERYMRSHTHSSCSRERVSRACDIHPSHVNRLVKAHTGMSFLRYMHELRVQRAEGLLAEGQLDVATIARACGFRQASHFIKVFKELRGSTPGSWRQGDGS
jgi:AraC-like DNA-binding protein